MDDNSENLSFLSNQDYNNYDENNKENFID